MPPLEQRPDLPKVGDNPGFSLTPAQYLDSNLLDTLGANSQISSVELDEATEIANVVFGSYGAALRECVTALREKRYEVSIGLIKSAEGEPVFILTAKNYDSGKFGIPNFNYLYEEDGLMGFDVKPGQKKYTMTSEDATRDFEFSRSHVQVDAFENLTRIILSRGSDEYKPFSFEVQYTPLAFVEALDKLKVSLKGSERYCHLYHEVLIPQLRKDMNAVSPDFLGEKFMPEISNKRSELLGNIAVVDADLGPKIHKFSYEMVPGDFDSPFAKAIRTDNRRF